MDASSEPTSHGAQLQFDAVLQSLGQNNGNSTMALSLIDRLRHVFRDLIFLSLTYRLICTSICGVKYDPAKYQTLNYLAPPGSTPKKKTVDDMK